MCRLVNVKHVREPINAIKTNIWAELTESAINAQSLSEVTGSVTHNTCLSSMLCFIVLPTTHHIDYLIAQVSVCYVEIKRAILIDGCQKSCCFFMRRHYLKMVTSFAVLSAVYGWLIAFTCINMICFESCLLYCFLVIAMLEIIVHLLKITF